MRILLASDGSPSSLRAAVHVAELAAGLPRTTIFLITVIPSLAERGNGERVLRQTMSPMHPAPIGIKTDLVTGAPAEAICEYAGRVRANFIVMGTRGQSLSKLLIGGVSENVIAQAPCPVMVVK